MRPYYIFENTKDPENGSRVVYRCESYTLSGASDNPWNKLENVQIGLAEMPVGFYLADRLVKVLKNVDFGPEVLEFIRLPYEKPMAAVKLGEGE
jgi:hypothetical protein